MSIWMATDKPDSSLVDYSEAIWWTIWHPGGGYLWHPEGGYLDGSAIEHGAAEMACPDKLPCT